jgi:flagellar biosynthetic protein FliR
VNVLEGLLHAEICLFALNCSRIIGLIMVTPLAWAHAPNRIKVVLVLLLSVVAQGQLTRAVIPENTLLLGPAIVMELAIGILIGLVVRFALAAAEICGETLSPAMGLGMAQAFDPATQANGTQISSILRHFSVLLALLLGVHRLLIGGLLAGFRLLPVGSARDLGATVSGLSVLSSAAINAGVRIALPLVAVLYMTQIALAFIARAAPQMQVFNVGFAVMLAVGLSLFALMMPDFARAFSVEWSLVPLHVEQLLLSLGAHR